ncbi:MAG: ATP-binding protein, partial [Lachnospiraceae bacterium]|nr:ATP-binding protein [Lachnospiraceae bacterium]
LLLLDEPASCLDSANTRLLEENLEKFSLRGFPLIIATHDVDFAWKWAKRILIFHQGRLIADDSPEKIFARKSLLSMCGLAQPLLYQTGELLGMNPLPKTMEELSLHISSSPA